MRRVSTKKRRIIVLSFTATFFIAILVYMPILRELLEKVIHREGSSHGLFVPFLSLYFIWIKRLKLKEIEIRFNTLGIIPISTSIFLYFLEIGGEKSYFQALSFIILISGLLILLMGKKLFKELSFPVLFLICMIPIPQGIYLSLAEMIREINLGVAAWFMSRTSIPFLQKELCIFLPNSMLSVDIGCSGIRYLLSYFVFGIAYAYIYRKRLMDRIFLIVLTIPISIFAGAMRISAISFCAYYIGSHMAEYRPHVLMSWSIFFIIGISLIILDRFWIKYRILHCKMRQKCETA